MSQARHTIGMVLVVAIALAGAGLGATSAASPADSGVFPQANETNGTNATDGADATNATNATDGTDSGNATDGTDATNATETELPPGISEDGVTNASALVDAHVEALSETGYRYTFSQEISFSFGNVTTGIGNGTGVPGSVTPPGVNVTAGNGTATPPENATAESGANASTPADNGTVAADNQTAADGEQQPSEPGDGAATDSPDVTSPIAPGDSPFGTDLLSSTTTSVSSSENGTVAEGLFPSYVVTESSIQFAGNQTNVTAEQWATDGVLLTQYSLANQRIFQRVNLSQNDTDSVLAFTQEDYERTVTKADIVATTLQSGDFEIVDTEQTDNETLYTLEAVSVSNETTSFGGVMDESTFNATVVVTQDGLVRELSMNSDAFGLSMSADFEVTQRGDVNVTQPDWTRVLLD